MPNARSVKLMPNNPVQITIRSACKTSNNSVTLDPEGNNQIQWQPAGQRSFTLKLPYGVFVGYETGTGTFDVAINEGGGFQPSPALTLMASPTGQTITNYIYESNA